MTRALAMLAAIPVVATGCATRGAVKQVRSDLAQLRSDLAHTRAAQESAAQDIARLRAELKAHDAHTREMAGRVRETADEVARLGTRIGAVEDTTRATRTRVEALATPLPAPPVAPPPARPAALPLPRPAAPLVERPPPMSREPPTGIPELAYASAMANFRAREHGQAVLDFLDFLARYPKHRLAGNAQYWIGEAYYMQRDYRQALVEFQKVLDLGIVKMPDALLKIGLCHLHLRDPGQARQMWQRVVRDYPNSEPAKLAGALLRTHASARR